MRDLNPTNTNRRQSVTRPYTIITRVLLAIGFVTLIQAAAWPTDRLTETRADEPSTVLESSTVEPSGDHIFTELLRHNAFRDAALERYSVVRTYEVRSATGRLYAREIVKMDYQAPSQKKFFTVSEEGSGLVRSLVLKRLIESEKETAAGKEHHDSSISPANYSFEMLGEEEVGDRRCFVVRAIPKREDKYLFEGTIWIDKQDYAIVKIAGHPAKRLSFWIEKADFVREYQKIGAFWFPAEDTTVVRVRLNGTKTLTIRHEEYQVSSILDQLWSESTPQRSARLGQLPAPADESSQP
jgi:Outer membrane lipoprotein-sorting protein